MSCGPLMYRGSKTPYQDVSCTLKCLIRKCATPLSSRRECINSTGENSVVWNQSIDPRLFESLSQSPLFRAPHKGSPRSPTFLRSDCIWESRWQINSMWNTELKAQLRISAEYVKRPSLSCLFNPTLPSVWILAWCRVLHIVDLHWKGILHLYEWVNYRSVKYKLPPNLPDTTNRWGFLLVSFSVHLFPYTPPGFHTEGGTGGIYPPHDFGKGGISPPSNCRTVFFLMGILVKSFKKVFRRQIPFFSKFVFSNCLPVWNK